MGALDKSTCFVRNVPTSVGEDRLTECFAEVGPVRKAFLVRTRGSDVHKGIAFVTFALPDDASKAVRELNAHNLDGKPLHVRSFVPVLVLVVQHESETGPKVGYELSLFAPMLLLVPPCCGPFR